MRWVTRYFLRAFPSIGRSIFPSVISKIELIPIQEKTIRISEGSQSDILIGGKLDGIICSESAKFMSQYIAEHEQKLQLRRKMVIELGCGTGLVGLSCAVFGANVLLTDWMPPMGFYPFSFRSTEILKLMKQNININAGVMEDGMVSMSLLEWGNDQHLQFLESYKPFDFIVGADITYDLSSLSKLLDTINILSTKDTIALICTPSTALTFQQIQLVALEKQLAVSEVLTQVNDTITYTVLQFQKNHQ